MSAFATVILLRKSGGTPISASTASGVFAANHLALAAAMLGDGLAVAVAPQLGGKLLQLGVALRIVAQAGRLQRLRSDHRRAGLDQFLDLGQQHGRHRFARRKHQQPVAHAVGQHEPAVFDLHAGEHHLGRATVERVGRARRVGQTVGGVFGLEIADVGHEQPCRSK